MESTETSLNLTYKPPPFSLSHTHTHTPHRTQPKHRLGILQDLGDFKKKKRGHKKRNLIENRKRDKWDWGKGKANVPGLEAAMSLFMAMVTKKNMELKIKFTYHLYICAEWSNVLSQFTCSFWISKQSVTAFLLTKKNFHIMVLKVIILNPVLTSKTKTEKNYFCGLNLVWIICFCSNHSNIVTAPLSHTLKRQNRGWRRAWRLAPSQTTRQEGD